MNSVFKARGTSFNSLHQGKHGTLKDSNSGSGHYFIGDGCKRMCQCYTIDKWTEKRYKQLIHTQDMLKTSSRHFFLCINN